MTYTQHPRAAVAAPGFGSLLSTADMSYLTCVRALPGFSALVRLAGLRVLANLAELSGLSPLPPAGAPAHTGQALDILRNYSEHPGQALDILRHFWGNPGQALDILRNSLELNKSGTSTRYSREIPAKIQDKH